MKTLLFASALMVSQIATAQEAINWPAEKSAVAWHTKKKMFMMKNLEPVGINSDVQIEVVKQGQTRTIQALIPVDKFNSGDETRDKDVAKILKGDVQPTLEYKSKPLSDVEYQSLVSGKANTLDGTLKIGGEEFPVKFSLQPTGTGADTVMTGSFQSSFSHFKIAPPSVAGGLVSKAQDVLNLHIRFLAKDIKGL